MRVRAEGPVLAAEMVTEGSAMWPALAMVVVGLALAVAGLAIVTGRGRGRRPSDPPPESDAAHREPIPTDADPPDPPRSRTGSLPAAEPRDTGDPGPIADGSEPTSARRGPPAVATHDGPCDWELRVDVSGGDPVVVREAGTQPCCVHVLRVRSLDAMAAPSEREHRTWSGDRTRIGPSRAVSDVRTDRRRVWPEVRGLGLALEATLDRQDGRPVTTLVEDVSDGESGHTAAEHLWEAHLDRLDKAEVASEPEEGPLRLQTATRYRHEVALRTTRGCTTGGHRVDAVADVSVALDGEVTPAAGARLTLPHVGGWVEGDLQVTATDPTEVLPGTEVHPAPGPDGASGLSVGAAPGSGEIRGSFAGHAETRLVDCGVELLVESAVVADIGLGEATGRPAARARVTVGVDHRIRLVVAPHMVDAEPDEHDGSGLECACAPAYVVQFGGGSDGAGQDPHATIHVEGRSVRLEADARPGTDQVPSWRLRPETAHDEAPRGITG